MQIITLTVIWDQSSSVTTFITQPGPGKQNKQITRCEIELQLLRHDKFRLLTSPDDPDVSQVTTHHESLGYLGTLMWWPRKFIVVIKMGKLVADQPSQTCGFSQGRVSDQEFRKLSQTSLEIIHTISDININWHWQDRNTIDCLAYWV